ncbi:MAG: sugar phosphate isomerase/epimerase [Planctomycetota bacterium]|jgi:sugar phosphate isomerase/epimerase|nr:sugar phosphate isomerase/epimerase [Planctomycetota bacterium]MDA1202134.1 sugar phosphate isomerase/epimerase [Planctomycetota bacterium]
MPASQILLSALADEAAFQLTAVEQFSALAALGLEYYSLRNIDVGKGIKNVMKLTLGEIQKVRHLEDEYGLNVASIASPIGKVKLVDKPDGTTNAYVPFKRYLAKDVARACELAHAFETKLIRGFSFYPPRDADPADYLEQAVEQIGQIAEACHRSDLTFGLEVEANLVGRTGQLLAEIHRRVNHPGLVLVFDAANLIVQGFSTGDVWKQWQAMKPGLGWIHVKDYRKVKAAARGRHVEEDQLANFVPADIGAGGHDKILADLRTMLPALTRKLKRRGIPGVFVDLEPHVRGGGQFGGTSGPDGMGIALRGLCRVLDRNAVGYHLRDFDDLLAARGL